MADVKKSKLSIIKKDDLLSNVVKDFPKAAELLVEYGLHCVNCILNQYETVDEGAKLHGMTDGEIKKMIDEINIELKK